MKMTIVDVFAEQAFAGNQLAVVHAAAALSTNQMQAIALETNFSETTFITRWDADSAEVRIFTPTHELPFAGHPTLGTAWVLTGGEGGITLNLKAGPVPVWYEQGVGWMTPPAVVFDQGVTGAVAAALTGLTAEQLDPDFPLRFATIGPHFLLIGVRDLAALRAVKIDEPLFNELQGEGRVFGVFVFTAESYGPDADYAARMFFTVDSIREDPATGSANAAFAAYLRELDPRERTLTVDQGVEIKRPSRLHLRIGETLAVGGRVQPVFEGVLQQLPAL